MLFEHLDLLRPDDLLVLDRGYPAAWLIAVLVQRAQHFCMRVDALGFSVVRAFLRSNQDEMIVEIAAPAAQDALAYECEAKSSRVRLIRVVTPNGRVIASTDKAVEDNKNKFQTGSELAMLDLENKAHYKAESIGVNIGTSISFDGALKPSGSGSGVGIGSDSGDASSTTQSGISGIAGNKDVRSDDKETGIDKIFDKDKVLSEIEAQKQITQAFNSLAPKAASDYASSQKSDLMRQAEQETDPEKKQALTDEAQKWGPNGSYNMAMNIIIGAAGGKAASAVSKETLSWAADQMRQAAIEDSKKFAGVCDSLGNCLDNKSGNSVGVNGDGFKLAGGRVVLAEICRNGRCTSDESTKSGYKENLEGKVIFNSNDAQGNSITLAQLIEQNPDWRSPLGTRSARNPLNLSFNLFNRLIYRHVFDEAWGVEVAA